MNLPRLLPVVATISLTWVLHPVVGQPPTMIGQPGAQPTARVVSLPPPPSKPTSQPTSQPGHVSTPAYVPLKPPQAESRPNSREGSLTEGLTDLIPPIKQQSATLGQGVAQTVATPLAAGQQPQFAPPAFPPLPSIQLPALPPARPVSLTLPNLPSSPQATPNAMLVAYGANPPAAPVAVVVEPEAFPAGRLIAVVGTEHILAGDMAVFVEPIIEQNRSRIGSPEEEQKIRSQLTRQALRQYCEIKAIYQEFFRDMVGTVPPKELEETKKKVVTRAGKIFFDKQVPVLIKKYEVDTIQDLERKLNEKSLSLMTLKGQFIEQVLASELERKYVPDRFEIDRQDLLDGYRDATNKEKWKVDGRVRWRQLTVRFDKHPIRAEAEARIRELGNQIFLGGKAFEAVARQSSDGYTASEGGRYDWTTQGSLKSKELDEALFVLPLNSLSQVIADDIGLHIIEVLEREEGHVKDFTEAQGELREELSNERRNKEVRKFRDRIMDRTTVWTLWPEDIPASRPLADALGIEAN